jgi:hypothetical protein
VYKKIVSLASLLAAAVMPLCAQDFSKFNFDIGGGPSTPLNPTAQYVGLSGNFVSGAGYNIDKHNSIIGEFMWAGMPPSLSILHPVNAPTGHVNLYTLTANYRYKLDNLGGSHFGIYAIAGGGWYYRYASVDKSYVVPPNTVCQPIYTWWGYGCDPSGFVYSATVAYRGLSSGGVNGGVGFSIRLSDSGWKFYVESRYHYAFTNPVASTLIPVTFGLRFN